MRFLFLLLWQWAAGAHLAPGAPGAPTASDDRIDFSRHILPILSDACFQCHGPDSVSREADLRFDDEQSVKRDRSGYAVVQPGDPDASEILQRLLSDDEDQIMPPPALHRPLTAAQIERIRVWIEQGAEWGQHWSLTRVERPQVTGPMPPIDELIQRELHARGWTAAPRADKRTLIRRLSLDLTGLPPTPQQVDEFLNDESPDAWERWVDRTLASPAFGERMAWPWLDAARYADSNGYQGDGERTMWPWRDWIVRAFNENLPFDQFTIWQIAGDQLPEATLDQRLATAFLRNHMINGEGGRIAEENRVDYVMDMTETVGTVWMGLTLNCCRCHDHKFDPLLQTDYYALTAFFNQTAVTGRGGDPQTPPFLEWIDDSQRERLAELEKIEHDAHAELEAIERSLWPRPEGMPASASPALANQPERIQNILDKPPNKRNEFEREDVLEQLRDSQPAWAAAYDRFTQARDARSAYHAGLVRVMVMEDMPEKRPTYVLDRGIYTEHGDMVEANVPAVLPPLPQHEQPTRLTLARWLTSREHPLMARVTVNRFWSMLFGVGLVKTSEDFGVQAEYPVQRELLEWLAAEFMESGWDTKWLIKQIVMSEAYMRSSDASPDAYARDPENRYLARGPRFRMPSWMIRDQALAVAGLLNASLGGKPFNGYQPAGVWEEATFGEKQYVADEGDELYRRSLYLFWRRIVGPTVLFDSAKRQVCEVQSLRTNTPMHALTTLNDVTYVEAARVLAGRLLKAHTDDAERLRQLALATLVRPLRDEEWVVWQRGLDQARAAYRGVPQSAAELLAVGQTPTDDDLPAEEHAAWTALCLHIMNLDEFLTKE